MHENYTKYYSRSEDLQEQLISEYSYDTQEIADSYIPNESNNRYIVSTGRLRLRKLPNFQSPIKKVLPKDTELIVKENTGHWAKVETLDGISGYVLSQYIKLVKSHA